VILTDPPTVAGFLTFIRQVMGIIPKDLPDNSPVIPVAFQVSKELVNISIAYASSIMYSLAVYNLAGDNLINYAPDVQGCSYFADLRASFNVNQFTAGVVDYSSDQGTSQGIWVIEPARQFTLSNLQNLKTPWGRRYLAIAQDYGPAVWGLT